MLRIKRSRGTRLLSLVLKKKCMLASHRARFRASISRATRETWHMIIDWYPPTRCVQVLLFEKPWHLLQIRQKRSSKVILDSIEKGFLRHAAIPSFRAVQPRANSFTAKQLLALKNQFAGASAFARLCCETGLSSAQELSQYNRRVDGQVQIDRLQRPDFQAIHARTQTDRLRQK